MRMYKTLIFGAAAAAFFIVVLGAFVRLSDAGLGCPDWPGCYGRLTVPERAQDVARAQVKFPGQPLQKKKAWIEMAHRYAASALGVLILVLAAMAWRGRVEPGRSPWLPTLLVAVVVAQGLLGMWTVTLLLRPAVVTLHLLGGMATFALLIWLALRQSAPSASQGIMPNFAMRRWAWLGLATLVLQIALGGWVSANYAALACPELPFCSSSGPQNMDFQTAYQLVRPLGATASGGVLSSEALVAIHWSHRVGALMAFLLLGSLSVRLLVARELRAYGGALFGALGLQIGLGLSIVHFALPLPLAVAHNAGAALLLATMVVVLTRLHRGPQGILNGSGFPASAYR
jgi:heme a synthase